MRNAKLSILCSITLLTSCAITDFLLPSNPSVEVNALAGKNVEQEKALAKVETGTTKQNADNISNDVTADSVNYFSNEGSMFQYVLIGLLVYFSGVAGLRPFKAIGKYLKSFFNKNKVDNN